MREKGRGISRSKKNAAKDGSQRKLGTRGKSYDMVLADC
jgi:hypothetical protein